MHVTTLESYERYLKGDESAFEDLVRTYGDALVRFACRYLGDEAAAEEVMEDTFVALIVNRKHFGTESRLRAYLYQIARNKAIDRLRRQKNEVPLHEVEHILTDTDYGEDPELAARKRALHRCIGQLPEQYREVLSLHYFDGFRIEECCKVMKKSKKQVYNLLMRARSALKEMLMKEEI